MLEAAKLGKPRSELNRGANAGLKWGLLCRVVTLALAGKGLKWLRREVG